MGQLQTKIGRVFRKAWRAYGKPTATAIKPLAEWVLPAGYAYSDDYDTITNAAGYVLEDPESYFVSDTVYIVPVSRTQEDQVLLAAGLLAAGSVRVGVLGADLALMENAHAIQIDGSWYDVADSGHTPPGVGASGHFASVLLKRRS